MGPGRSQKYQMCVDRKPPHFPIADAVCRMSPGRSKNPNLQNLPRESTTLRGSSDGNDESVVGSISIRRALKAAPGCVFVASDFCQLEVRILAHFCEDDKLQRFLCDGGDPFISLASDWLSIPMQSVTETERAKAKQCVYGEFAVTEKQ